MKLHVQKSFQVLSNGTAHRFSNILFTEMLFLCSCAKVHNSQRRAPKPWKTLFQVFPCLAGSPRPIPAKSGKFTCRYISIIRGMKPIAHTWLEILFQSKWRNTTASFWVGSADCFWVGVINLWLRVSMNCCFIIKRVFWNEHNFTSPNVNLLPININCKQGQEMIKFTFFALSPEVASGIQKVNKQVQTGLIELLVIGCTFNPMALCRSTVLILASDKTPFDFNGT